jgi:hypothetical protein
MPCCPSFIKLSHLRSITLGLARDIAELHGDSRIQNNIMSHFDNGYLSARLGVTVKSHKDPGSQSVRTIHRAVKPKFHGLSQWIIHVLEPLLDEVPWVLEDSHSVAKYLRSLTVPESVVAYKVDLKDFYLSGTDEEIAIAVSDYLRERGLSAVAAVMHKVLFFVLSNQFVQPVSLQHLMRCICGSGIGLNHSAVVANLLFFILVERGLVDGPLKPLCWVRYHDDCIALMHQKSQGLPFFSAMKSKSSVFRIKCESVHLLNSSFVFLDLNIALASPNLIVVASQVKPITPLCPTSAHAPNVHSSWPSSVCNRIHTLSLGDEQALSLSCVKDTRMR